MIRFLILTLLCMSSAFAQSSITVGFSRGQPSAKDVVLQAVGDARESLYIAAYQFTSKDIIQAVVAAKQRGVRVAVVLDRSQKNGDSQAVLVASGIECQIDYKYRIMHHKFIVVDQRHVETGSFNYSQAADKSNAENVLYLKNALDLAAKYKAQWDLLNDSASPCIGGG